MKQKWKRRIDDLVRIWLDAVVSYANEAGWPSESLTYKVFLFGGTPPKGSGMDQSNTSSIIAMRSLREPHALYFTIAPIIQQLRKKKPPYMDAILAKHFYCGINPQTNKTWTDQERAAKIDQSYKTFQYNLEMAYKAINEKLELVDTYEETRKKPFGGNVIESF